MSKKKPPTKDQMTFQFTVDVATLMSLEGGSQETLSDFEFRFRQMLKSVLDECGKREKDPMDRFEVAARMSRLLGREITKTHIDHWTAMSTVQRRIHVDALKALCEVLSDMRPLHFFVEACGFKALSPDEALCAEYGAMMLVERKMKRATKNLLSDVDEDRIYSKLIKRITGGGE